MDSKLVVEQMSGRWRVKHPDMIPLHQRAKELAAGFESVSFSWIPREKNSHADRLANEAMDAAGDSAPEPPAAVLEPASLPDWRGARSTPTRLLLLRHGQTELSVNRRYSGRGNPALTELGRRQAAAAAAVSGSARRHRRRDQLPVAACPRHREGGSRGARSRRHRGRRSHRDRLRRLGRAHVRRGRRAGSRAARALAKGHQRHAPERREFRRGGTTSSPRAKPTDRRARRRDACWWCRT